jgi:hypothetical protein
MVHRVKLLPVSLGRAIMHTGKQGLLEPGVAAHTGPDKLGLAITHC